MKNAIILLLLICLKAEGFKKGEEKERRIATSYGDENAVKLVGFDDLDGRYQGKENDKQRQVVDPDTALLILPPKPIIVMPQFIVPKRKMNKFKMINQFFI
jgi:hypothetical protein